MYTSKFFFHIKKIKKKKEAKKKSLLIIIEKFLNLRVFFFCDFFFELMIGSSFEEFQDMNDSSYI